MMVKLTSVSTYGHRTKMVGIGRQVLSSASYECLMIFLLK